MSFTVFTYNDPKPVPAILAYDPASFYFDAGILVTPGTQPPNWGAFTLPNGTLNVAYSAQWTLTNCATPVTYSLLSGTLPTGLSLSSIAPATGQLAGTPTVLGTFSFTLRATNSVGHADHAFSVTISAAPSGGSFVFLS